MKHLYRYAEKAESLARELADSLSESDVRLLFDELSQAGKDAYQEWVRKYSQDIFDYISATPAKRKKHKSAVDEVAKALLVYSAFRECLNAAKLLRIATDYAFLPGGAYRDTTARAAEIYAELTSSPIDEWPWPGGGPFVEEPA